MCAAVHGVHVVEFEVVGTAADGRAVVGEGQAGEDEREGGDEGEDEYESAHWVPPLSMVNGARWAGVTSWGSRHCG